MPFFRSARGCAQACLFCAALLTGCSTPARQAPLAVRAPSPAVPRIEETSTGSLAVTKPSVAMPESSSVRLASHDDSQSAAGENSDAGAELFGGQVELSLPHLIEKVEARNPTVQAALAAWGAAAEKAPQAAALDDPMLQTMAAPGTFASNSSTQSSYIIGVGQKLPWFGKRALRGQAAEWERVAASLDHSEVQLKLAEATRLAFYDYYYAFRRKELNDANLQAVKSSRDTARSKFEANQVTQQDLLQAEVELARIEQMGVEIDQARDIASAQINLLLHRDQGLALPPPPQKLEAAPGSISTEELRTRALEQRPDLSAAAARVHAAQNALALTLKEYYPDFEVMGKYDSFWADVVQRGQIALNLNIPLNQGRRGAAVREAMFNCSKTQAEYNQRVDSIKNEVQTSLARLEASRRTLELFEHKLLPATEDNVAAATSGYTAGTIDFLRLVQAQREFLEINQRYQQAIVEFHRNRAELDRVSGTPLDRLSP